MSNPIVKVENLSHRYTAQWAVRDISFDIKDRGVIGLLGSNGAGKSTTMNIICGVLSQTAGRVLIDGVDTKEDPVAAKRHIGFLPQKPPLYSDLTVDEYLVYSAKLRLIEPRSIRSAVEQAKERCGIGHFSKRLTRNLSGGYQQRLGIAQAIVHDPAFVVLDEPTNGLDPIQIVEIRELIKHIAQDRSVLISTHILPEVQVMCDEIRMIEHGRMVFSGSMEEFDNHIEPRSFIVTFADAAPAPEAMLAIEGVTGAVPLTGSKFRISFTPDKGITERFAAISATNGWRLSEISLEKSSIEAVFAQLSGHNTHGGYQEI